MNKILASILVVAAMAASPAQAQSVDEAARSIQADIRGSLVVTPAAPVAMSVPEAIREQGDSAARSILVEAQLALYVNTAIAGQYAPVERSGLVTVSEVETVEDTNTESVEL